MLNCWAESSLVAAWLRNYTRDAAAMPAIAAVFPTERLKSRKTNKTLIYTPMRRAQEFLGRFQKGLPGRGRCTPCSALRNRLL